MIAEPEMALPGIDIPTVADAGQFGARNARTH